MFTRTQNRNASTGIDAVFFNPAGLTKLNDGFYLSLNNQTINQTRKITNDYPYLSGHTKGIYRESRAHLFTPVFMRPSRQENLPVSAGFNPIGGGGGATYEKGLPSFEMSVADLVPRSEQQEHTPATQ